MNKRLVAGILWLFAGWYLGNIVTFEFGLSDAIGPILGVLAAAIVAGDPLGLIWKRAVGAPARTGSTRPTATD